jgi:hypothetical protein
MKLLPPLLLALAGGAVGSGSAYATARLIGPAEPVPEAAAEARAFLPSTRVLAPLVLGDGRLAGYVSLDFAVEVPAGEAEAIAARLPLLLNAINMRTHRTPMASGPDGLVADLEAFRKVVIESADEAFGKGIVSRAAITGAEPA